MLLVYASLITCAGSVKATRVLRLVLHGCASSWCAAFGLGAVGVSLDVIWCRVYPCTAGKHMYRSGCAVYVMLRLGGE